MHCESCGDVVTGQAKFCPACGFHIIPKRPVKPGRQEEPERKPCPFCAEMIKPEAVRCRYCKASLGEIPGEHEDVLESSKKSPEVAALLSLLLPGAGHYYAGHRSRAFKVLAVFFAGLFLVPLGVGVLVSPVVYVYSVFDAFKSAKIPSSEQDQVVDAGKAANTVSHFINILGLFGLVILILFILLIVIALCLKARH